MGPVTAIIPISLLGRELGLVVLDTANVVTVGDADMIIEVRLCGPRVVPDLFNFGLESLPHILLESLQLLSGSPALLEQHIAANLNWVSRLTHVGDLVLGPVGDARVGHGVAVVSVRRHLKVEGAVLDDIGTSPLDCLFDHEDVLSLDFEAGDIVTSSIEVCVMGGAFLRRSHTVGVVLANIDNGEAPETGNVGSLEELSLVRRTVTVQGEREVLLALVLLGEGEPGADG